MNHTDRSFIFVIWYRWNLPPVCFKQILKSCCETKSLLSTSALRSDLLSMPKLHRAHLICIDSVPAIFPSCENNEMVSPKITNGCRQIEEILLSNENPTVQMVRTLCLLLDKKKKKQALSLDSINFDCLSRMLPLISNIIIHKSRIVYSLKEINLQRIFGRGSRWNTTNPTLQQICSCR